MSLYIDMKIMRSWKISQTNTTGSASMLSSSRHSGKETKYTILSCAHTFGDRGSSGNSPPRHSTKSEKTYTFAFNCSKRVTCYSVQVFHGLRLQSSLHGSSFPPQKGNCLRQCISQSRTRDCHTVPSHPTPFRSLPLQYQGRTSHLVSRRQSLGVHPLPNGWSRAVFRDSRGLRTTAQLTAKRTVLRYHSVEVTTFLCSCRTSLNPETHTWLSSSRTQIVFISSSSCLVRFCPSAALLGPLALRGSTSTRPAGRK